MAILLARALCLAGLLAAVSASRDLQAVEDARPGSHVEEISDVSTDPFCAASAAHELDGVREAYNNNGQTIAGAQLFFPVHASQLKPIGCTSQLLAESSDAYDSMELVADGRSGLVDFPFGDFQPIFTVGEYDSKSGYVPAGPPVGQGVFASGPETLTMVFNSASSGHVNGKGGESNPSWYYEVNGGGAMFTGSHISFIEYNRSLLPEAVETGKSVGPSVIGAGAAVARIVNLEGEKVDDDNPHYGDSSASGKYVSDVSKSDSKVWTLHRLASGRLEEAHQWGEGIGFEETVYLTAETSTTIDESKAEKHGFAGLTAHVLDVDKKTLYAAGALGAGGFQKIVEFSCGNPGYVCLALSGYNGNFGYRKVKEAFLNRKKAIHPTRPDGTDWVYPQHIVPARIYVGLKGYTADGTECKEECGFLERNGLAFGRVYGFAVPRDTANRDEWHTGRDRTHPTARLTGMFAPTSWQWDGKVRDFEYDQAWDFQVSPMNVSSYKFWTALDRDTDGEKLEHVAADPRGNPRFLQASTAGYIGMYALKNLTEVLAALRGGELPHALAADYELVEGTVSIKDRIRLGGEGRRADGGVQNEVHTSRGETVESLASLQGLDWVAAGGNKDFVMVQEDSNNLFGERTFLFELPGLAEAPTYYFLAQAGGADNTRAQKLVCIPEDTATDPQFSEFHGSVDMSGALNQLQVGGKAKRDTEALIPINEKLIAVGLVHPMCESGIMQSFGLDQGGQIYAFKPDMP